MKMPSLAICRPSSGKSPFPASTRRAVWKQRHALRTRSSLLGPLIRVARCWKCLTGFPRNPAAPSAAFSKIPSSAA